MATLDILTYPNPILRKKCEPVKEVTDEIRSFLDDMTETMYANQGIGLAAIQVGRLIRAIVVDIQERDETIPRQLYKLVNPEIIESTGKIRYEEGCLSVPGVREDVVRADKVTVKALDETGKEVIIEAEGLLAICFQHEIDHLNGVLFVDKLTRLRKELVKSKLKKLAL